MSKKNKRSVNYYVCTKDNAVFQGRLHQCGDIIQAMECPYNSNDYWREFPIHPCKFAKKFRKIGMKPIKIMDFTSALGRLYGNKVDDDEKFRRAMIIVFSAEGRWCFSFLNDILKDFDHFKIYEYRDGSDSEKFYIALRFIEPGHLADKPLEGGWMMWNHTDFLEGIFEYTEELNLLIKLFKGDYIEKKYKKFKKEAKKTAKKERKKCKILNSNSEDTTTPTENSQQPSSEE